MSDHWTDRIVGDRMAVDREFADRVAESQFTSEQWNLIMTAVGFEIENPADEDAATLVADTSDLPTILPELDAVTERSGPMGEAHPPAERDPAADEGLLTAVKNAIGLDGAAESGGLDEERLAAAEALVDEYAAALQDHLEGTERWADVRAAVAAEQ